MKYIKAVRIAKDDLEEHKAEDVAVVDVRNSTPFTDYYVIATAPNERALGALADEVEDALEKENIEVRKKEGLPESGWVIVDAGQVVIHLFISTKRKEIDLDSILKKALQKK
jgi:ribosome-associated protein